MMDTGNEVWKLGGRENKKKSGRRLEESAAGGEVSLSNFFLFFPPDLCHPFAPNAVPSPLQGFLSVCVCSSYFCLHVDVLVVKLSDAGGQVGQYTPSLMCCYLSVSSWPTFSCVLLCAVVESICFHLTHNSNPQGSVNC